MNHSFTRLRLSIALSLIIAHVFYSVHAIGDVDHQNCAKCQGLDYCTAMNEQFLYDPIVNYTREQTHQLEKQGVCEDLDEKTNRLIQFGDTTMFKDTLKCRKLVYNYYCLSWVASTFQRTINNERVNCRQGSIPLPPCRSLCVQVADTCIYSHFYRLYLENVCGNIPCITEAQENSTHGEMKQAPCVKGAWELTPNSSFSRCSIRAYTAPKAESYQCQTGHVLLTSLLVIAVLWS